jgi:phosphonate transport system substrate-binding protein
MGRPVQLVAPDSYSDTIAALADGSYDFACLGALQYIRAHAKYGVIPLVQRAADRHYLSIFITPVHSRIQSLSDLKDKQFAFGDIGSTSAHLMAYRELKDAGIDPETDFKFRYSGSHLATAALVASGAVDAGAIDKTVYDYLVSSGQVDGAKIRVFYTSKPYIDYVYVARKDLPAAEREKFARALLALKPGKDDLILKVLRADKFVMANDEEYGTARAIAHELRMF